ncbi:translation initiation factor IF-2 [Desulfobacca acetoxidans]|uniref:Translation initiation factor IF-2 n=1 Tax=Desulfobacca acetoxidans (strain ATCC 700848 / DSM 11109 / ASRB2) TaxID=880072 RepID=F2NFJ3_DESAR|nr:translation initiation factor IF-2 [Desulfobacca acetoxidans]AEB10112.1 translation initiation factor IF-2 [Desulfobacca acetoxidans DSM 11109]
MAKTRVTHLAKEFNLDVKELILRLREINIEVENYLSSIDATDVARAREVLAKTVPLVEEQRVGSNVKRRRTLARPKPMSEKTSVSAFRAGQTVEQGSILPSDSPVAEIQALPPDAPVAAVKPGKPLAAPPKRRRTVDKPAKIIALPEAPKKPVTVVEEAPAEIAPEIQIPIQLEIKSETPAAYPAEQVEVQPDGMPLTVEPEETTVAPEISGRKSSRLAEAKTPDASMALKRQKAKKARKDTPARIISLPPVEEAAAPVATSTPARRTPRVIEITKTKEEKPVVAVADKEEKKGRVKKKRGKKPGAAEDDASKKKAFRKKEIREGAELYEGKEAESIGGVKKKGVRKAIRKMAKTELTVPKAIKRRVKVGDAITVGELAKKMGIKFSELVKKLMGLGIMANINQPLDYDAAVLVASEFGYEVERATLLEEDILNLPTKEEGELLPRPPVVTIMGHVDHGKTSLLDAIRQSHLIDREAGGITQHIGAYQVSFDHGEVVFLDTPGHEAFTAMRARGAQVTDIVVLVVAADDGVMPQTLEAINHAKAAGVPLVVAVNKIDKPDANPDRVKRELADRGVVPEEWGGDVQFAEVSAKKIIGIDDLLEKILLQAEILELKSNSDTLARGRIIEAKLDKGRGAVGTVLVQNGTLKAGDVFVCGLEYGRVRAMFDDRGLRVEQASPSTPVEVQGFSGVPQAGDEFIVLENERVAKQVAQMRQLKQREAAMARLSKVTLEKLYERFQEGMVKELNLILKADVQGSIEALTQALQELGNKEIKVNIIHTGAGDISETDIMLASASNAIVIGFNVRANPKAQSLAEQEQVDVRFYDVIYNLVNDVHSALEGMLEPIFEERSLGRVEVRQVFTISKLGTIAGSYVLDGKVERNSLVRVKRNDAVIYEGKIASLKRFKDDVKEVQAGYECGIGLEKFNELHPGDIIEIYQMEEIKPHLAPIASKTE